MKYAEKNKGKVVNLLRFFPSRLIVLLVVGCVLLPLNGCDHFVEVNLPPTQLTSEAVFNDRQTANAAMAEIYYQLRANGLLSGRLSGLSASLGLYADELTYWGDDSITAFDYHANSILPNNGDVHLLWTTTYNQIYAANSLLEGVASSVALSTTDKEQLRGEGLFVRALLHFYLTALFGDIPYISTTDYRLNNIAIRVPETMAYGLVIADLVEASELLGDYPTEGRVRPNQYAVQALLARVYLYDGKWAEAANASSAVLNATDLYSAGSTATNFLKDSNSTIWHLMPPLDGQNTDEGATFIFTSGPPPQVSLAATLVDDLEPGDNRKTNWIGTITDGTASWYHVNKYKEQLNTGTSVEYPIVLRIGEQYLIRAEARARQGELIGAKEDLDILRGIAGLGPSGAVSQEDVLQAILRERRIELLTEFGHRFFDLRRFGRLDTVLGATKMGWESHEKFFPIPEAELLLNPNLNPQNDGY